ncbi:MAG: 30S ribosomal protein S7 [Patescibacteria group bacterium]
MRRKHKIHREVTPDAKFANPTIGKFINYVMERGKKSTAQKIVYDAFSEIEHKTKQNPLEVFDLAIKNASPMLEIKSRRIGGATYQVPHEVKGERKLALSIRWILTAARGKKGAAMALKLADELISASKNEGAAIKRKIDTQRMAEANKAFAHFAR